MRLIQLVNTNNIFKSKLTICGLWSNWSTRWNTKQHLKYVFLLLFTACATICTYCHTDKTECPGICHICPRIVYLIIILLQQSSQRLGSFEGWHSFEKALFYFFSNKCNNSITNTESFGSGLCPMVPLFFDYATNLLPSFRKKGDFIFLALSTCWKDLILCALSFSGNWHCHIWYYFLTILKT